jgi:hypothetical protein
MAELHNIVLFIACLLKIGCYTGLILAPIGLIAYKFTKFKKEITANVLPMDR